MVVYWSNSSCYATCAGRPFRSVRPLRYPIRTSHRISWFRPSSNPDSEQFTS